MLTSHTVHGATAAGRPRETAPVIPGRVVAKHRRASAGSSVLLNPSSSDSMYQASRQRYRHIRVCALDHGQQLVAAVAESTQDPLLSAAAWFVVLAATAASLSFMFKAFFEAKSAIQRRDERQKAKEQEDQEKQDERQQKIKKMFERL